MLNVDRDELAFEDVTFCVPEKLIELLRVQLRRKYQSGIPLGKRCILLIEINFMHRIKIFNRYGNLFSSYLSISHLKHIFNMVNYISYDNNNE